MTPARILPSTVPAPSVNTAPPLDIPAGTSENLAALVLGFYLALQAMWANEFIHNYLNVPVPILILSGLPVVLFWIMLGRQGLFWQCGVAAPYLLVLLWWWVCTAFGSLKGYYIEMLQYGIRFHLTPFIICGIAAKFGLLRTIVTGYGLGFIGLLALCWKFGGIDSAGRFAVPNTSLQNPNDLALNLLIGLAFLSVFAFDRSILKKLVWFLSFGLTLFFVLRTGSRANLLTLGVMLMVIFFTSKSSFRIMFVVSTVLMAGVMLVMIPRATLVRLTTFFSFSEEDYSVNEQVANAASSTEARRQLQVRAVKVASQHPVFGVGPHMFLYALDEYMRLEENRAKGSWQHSHNTYLDLVAETGFPGLILYCIPIFWCIRTNFRIFQRAQREPPLSGLLGVSISLLMASVAFAFGTLFCSWPYWATYCYVVGLTAASYLVLQDFDRRRWMANSAPAPVPAATFPNIGMNTPANSLQTPMNGWRFNGRRTPRR